MVDGITESPFLGCVSMPVCAQIPFGEPMALEITLFYQKNDILLANEIEKIIQRIIFN